MTPPRPATPQHRADPRPRRRLPRTRRRAGRGLLLAVVAISLAQPPSGPPTPPAGHPAAAPMVRLADPPPGAVETFRDARPGPLPQPPASAEAATGAAGGDAVRPLPAAQPWTVTVHGWTRPYARGHQARLDACQATLWWGPYTTDTPELDGSTWLAGHNHCGFWRWSRLHRGDPITVTSPAGTRHTYTVTDQTWIDHQGGTTDRRLIHSDLILQTCLGAGTVLTYAERD